MGNTYHTGQDLVGCASAPLAPLAAVPTSALRPRPLPESPRRYQTPDQSTDRDFVQCRRGL